MNKTSHLATLSILLLSWTLLAAGAVTPTSTHGGRTPAVRGPRAVRKLFIGQDGAFRRSMRSTGEFLRAHNRIRRTVGESPYVWNRSLAQYARRWANRLSGECQGIHSEGPYGENIFWGTGQVWHPSDAVQSWGLEHYDYDATSNSCRAGRMCGHYTQIVWNATARVGCGVANCDGGGTIVVCSYDPPGNFIGESPFL